MPTPAPPSRVSRFGPEYEQLLMTAFQDAPFRFPFPTPGHAQAFKMRIYEYFRALREENLRLDLVEMADNLQVSKSDCVLVFEHKSEAWDARAIRDVLQLPKGFASGKVAGGSELRVPDLTHSKLTRKLAEVRARNAAGKGILPPE